MITNESNIKKPNTLKNVIKYLVAPILVGIALDISFEAGNHIGYSRGFSKANSETREIRQTLNKLVNDAYGFSSNIRNLGHSRLNELNLLSEHVPKDKYVDARWTEAYDLVLNCDREITAFRDSVDDLRCPRSDYW